MTRQRQRHASTSGRSAGSGDELSTNERLVGEISVMIAAEFVFSFIMLALEVAVAADPGGPFGKGHFYEPILIGMLTFLSLLARFASSVLWCWWSTRVVSIIRDAGVVRLRRATSWSAVWWFVPGFNFVMPYLVIRELLKAAVAISERRIENWSSMPVPVFLHVWWGSWALHLLAYVLVMVVSFLPTNVSDSAMLLLYFVRDAALLVAAPLAIFLLVKINGTVPEPDSELSS